MLPKISSGKTAQESNLIYDDSTMKVIVLACLVIFLSVFLTGTLSYSIMEKAIVNKLKSQDLVYIIQSVTTKIDERIGRAKETSLVLAEDPTIVQWIKEKERNPQLTVYAQKKIKNLAEHYDYANSFIVSSLTNHYWAENGKIIDTVSPKDPDDSWFFQTLHGKKTVSLSIDYNQQRKDTFVFVNALVGDLNHPLGVVGVGLSLQDISRQFQNYKFGGNSNLWLIDSQGKIQLSEDLEHRGKKISEFIPAQIEKKLALTGPADSRPIVLQYTNSQHQIMDLIVQPMQSNSWKAILQIPRRENLYLLDSIRLNTITSSVFALILIILIFFLISKKIADPFKRAMLLNQELEKKVQERTQELREKNQKITDSIDYAKRIQESILPSPEKLSQAFSDHFVIWKPRDIVGGDFFWLKSFGNCYLLALGDCTGHGVPGALMTMTVNSILNHLVEEVPWDNPGIILEELNIRIKETLHSKSTESISDDGLDLGICCIKEKQELIFAGAKISLYVKKGEELQLIKGDNKSIGYKTAKTNWKFTNHTLAIEENNTFYLTTDGYLDQNGGEKDYSFGRKRFHEIILQSSAVPLNKQQEIFQEILDNYKQDQEQRDDITVIGFRVGKI